MAAQRERNLAVLARSALSASIRTAVRETAGRALVIVTGKGQETRMLRRHGAEPCEADGPVLERALVELS